jgi:hypothetical protein
MRPSGRVKGAMFGLGSDSIFRKKKKHHQIRLFRVSLLARIRGFIACRARRAARSPHDRGEKSAVAHNDGVLARAVFFHRLGEIRDRTFENQRYRDSGLNLAVAAIILWNTVYLSRAVPSCVPRVRLSAVICLPMSRRSAGSTSPSTAITFGPQSRSKMTSGHCGILAQHS